MTTISLRAFMEIMEGNKKSENMDNLTPAFP